MSTIAEPQHVSENARAVTYLSNAVAVAVYEAWRQLAWR